MWQVVQSAQRFMDEAVAAVRERERPVEPGLFEILQEHLGVVPASLPLVTEQIDAQRVVDADIALEIVAERDPAGRLVGIGGGNARQHHDLSEMVGNGPHVMHFGVGAPDYVSMPTGPDSDRRVLVMGLRLFHFRGEAVAVLQRGANPQFGRPLANLDILTAASETAEALIGELRELMVEHSVLRGQVLSFTGSDYEPGFGNVTFHRRPTLTEDEVVLAPGVLAKIGQHVVGIGRHRDALRAAGQHLKRGVLLYGPPGTGKTHTVRYLIGAAPETTVILLAGGSLGYVSVAAQTARALAPAIVVLEDCDLVAEERGMHGGPQPLLFEVLDVLDGLAPDVDVAFVLTTNRADVLEPALVQRPGRIDLAVEIPLPDTLARRRLFRLYADGLDLPGSALDAAADACEGTTASFAKELIRRAVLGAAEQSRPVTEVDLEQAVRSLLSDRDTLTRALLGSRHDRDEED